MKVSGPGAELTRELGGAPSELCAPLNDAEQRRLLDSLRAAKRKQQDDLVAAINEGLSFVPGLLRGTLKRILFP